MADFSYQQIAATLASGILATKVGNLKSLNPDEQAAFAVDLYDECLKKLQPNPAEPPHLVGV